MPGNDGSGGDGHWSGTVLKGLLAILFVGGFLWWKGIIVFPHTKSAAEIDQDRLSRLAENAAQGLVDGTRTVPDSNTIMLSDNQQNAEIPPPMLAPSNNSSPF